jgi:sugar phosphate isomerase/epimerase
MMKLLSLSDDEYSLQKFGGKAAHIEAFLAQNGFDGLELMRWENPQEDAVPMGKVVGRHMPFWPIFFDFWRGDRKELLRQFDSAENCRGYYFADTKDAFVRQRREEFIDAARMGVGYVVVHISHAQLEHCYTGAFTYSDEEVIDAYIDMLNEALSGVSANYAVLFENHWLPGLTFLDGRLAMRLLEGVAHPNKGFVLDISHLMNTAGSLPDERRAVEYILETLGRLGEAKRHIRAVHLNSSILGERTRQEAYDAGADYFTRLMSAMKYVGQMDPHKPFSHPDIRRVIENVNPQYLTFELSGQTFADLQAAVAEQNAALGNQ